MANNPLDVHIAEYQSLRQEIQTRIQAITTLTGSVYTAIFAVIGAISVLSPKININDLIVFVPLIASPLALIWLEHVIQIHRIGRHLHFTLRTGIVTYLQESGAAQSDGVMQWGSSEPLLPERVDRLFRAVHHWLGGVFVFVLLIPVCTAYVCASEGWMKWRHPLVLSIDAFLSILFLLLSIVFAYRTGTLILL